MIDPCWPVLPIFRLISGLGGVAEEEMRLAFNMGVGFLMVTPEPGEVIRILEEAGEKPFPAGEIITGRGVLYRKAEA